MHNLIYNCGDKFEYYEGEIIELNNNQVFVFGSNLAGRHGAGAAKKAKEDFGAVYGIGEGSTGECYAIPTKCKALNTLSLIDINFNVATFLHAASMYSRLQFLITKVGCGLAGYNEADIAPMFKVAPSNCVFNEEWRRYLE